MCYLNIHVLLQYTRARLIINLNPRRHVQVWYSTKKKIIILKWFPRSQDQTNLLRLA